MIVTLFVFFTWSVGSFAVPIETADYYVTAMPDDELLIFDVSNETDEECRKEFDDVKLCLATVSIKHKNGQEEDTMFFDKQAMISIIDDFENSNCFGLPSNCTNVKVGKYIYDTLLSIGSKIYRDGFECIKKEFKTLQEKAQSCFGQILMNADTLRKTTGTVNSPLMYLGECVFKQLECKSEEKDSLIIALREIVGLMDAYSNPEIVLQNIGASSWDITDEELNAVMTFFSEVF